MIFLEEKERFENWVVNKLVRAEREGERERERERERESRRVDRNDQL